MRSYHVSFAYRTFFGLCIGNGFYTGNLATQDDIDKLTEKIRRDGNRNAVILALSELTPDRQASS